MKTIHDIELLLEKLNIQSADSLEDQALMDLMLGSMLDQHKIYLWDNINVSGALSQHWKEFNAHFNA